MSVKTLDVKLDTIEKTALHFLELNKNYKKFAVSGSMGAGKTTFITAICKILKATDLVSSPTFSIVNEYVTENNEVIYHFDFYRVKTPEELFDIGFEEYCRNDAWCFIEWPEKAEGLIPENFLKVLIETKDNEGRIITFDN